MFPNLEAEMARKKITQYKLAEILWVTPTTLSFKLNGRSTLSLKMNIWESRWIWKSEQDRKVLFLYLKTEKRKENSMETII